MTNCITEEELQSLSQSWKLAYVNTIISKPSQVSAQEFDLDEVKGKVVTTKKVIVPTFQTLIVKGLTKACPCVGGTIPQMCKYNGPRQYL